MRGPGEIEDIAVVRVQCVDALPGLHVDFAAAAEDGRAAFAGQFPYHHELVVTTRGEEVALATPADHIHAGWNFYLLV